MRIAIVGAGLAGLTTAYELRGGDLGADAHIDVFEASDRIGGKLFTVPFNDGPVDLGAEAFLARREDALEFFTELGLADSLVEPSGKSSLVYSQSNLQDLPRGGVMGIPSTSAPVAHLVSEETVRRIDAENDAEAIDWTVGEDRSIGQLVRERYGDEVVDRIVSSLLGGVYSCLADDLGVRATVPQLAEALDSLAQAREKVTLSAAVAQIEKSRPAPSDGPVKPVFNAFAGGYAELYETLAEKSQADIHLDTFVSGITFDAKTSKYTITGQGVPGDTEAYDRVVVAAPAPTTARLLSKVAPEAAAALKPVKLASSAVVGLKFDSDAGLPDNSGVLIAADQPGVHAKAFTFSSKKWPHLKERIGDGALIRASFGRFGDDALAREEEDTLVDYALDDLLTITGFDARVAGVSEIYTQRWFGGLPRFDDNHLATVATVREKIAAQPGLEVTGAWAGGVGVPAVIADARAAAQRILGS
ncbi:protoporphyrinogen oxidase [Corynebacterium stationis]|uniref:protoporphyrinogen oxidase n=1 Tax=Corynebacterium stationis TaxID=1705 RepID=UPI0028B0DEAF|nr:protoporphyrinogen oxidase [Corynebacterium stationis]